MSNSWRFIQPDWHNIMEDFRQKVRDTKNYDRIEYSRWRSLMSAVYINITYDEVQKEFYISCYDKNNNCVAGYLFGADKTTTSGKQTFGDYLATYVVHIPEEEEKLATNYDTATTTTVNASMYASPGGANAKISPAINYDNPIVLTADDIYTTINDIINSSNLATGYAINSSSQITNKTEIEENNKMDNKIFNFDFGPVKGDNIRMSMYGLAIKNRDGNYVAWDKVNENIMNVDILNFNGDGLMYKMPVAIKDIKDGDIVIHNKVPMFVLKVFEKSLDVIDIYSGERKSIMLAKSPFNFNFATKVISLIDFGTMDGATPSEDNPFGNMWPLLMLGDSSSVDPMMLALMCAGKGDCANPMMMYALMASKSNNDNLLPFMFMMNGGKFGC